MWAGCGAISVFAAFPWRSCLHLLSNLIGLFVTPVQAVREDTLSDMAVRFLSNSFQVILEPQDHKDRLVLVSQAYQVLQVQPDRPVPKETPVSISIIQPLSSRPESPILSQSPPQQPP